MTNFVMSLASSPWAERPVHLSANSHCHYHYSNLTKVLENWQAKESDFRSFIRDYLPGSRFLAGGIPYYSLTHDVTKLLKAHSPCLASRQYVPTSNNVIRGNRSLGVGYPVSALHLGTEGGGWCPPVALKRLEPEDDTTAVAVEQIRSIIEADSLPFGEALCLLRADSWYGKAIFLAPLYEIDNLVLVVRLRPGIKVWTQAKAVSTGGAPRIYDKKYYLTEQSQSKTYHKNGKPYQVWQEALYEQTAGEYVEKEALLSNNRSVIICIRRWDNLLIRSKNGAMMKDKPFDVLSVKVLDAADRKPVFDRPLFLAVSGKRKNLIESNDAQQQYRERFDVEPYYRFAKNRLLIDKLQTPDIKHLDCWIRIVQITSWLLFTARYEVGQIDYPAWQKYLPKNKITRQNPIIERTIAQTQRGTHRLFSTFDPEPFLPQKCKKGKGRQVGHTCKSRERFPVAKKKPRIRKNQINE